MEDLPRLRLPQREAVANRAAILMDAGAALDVPNEQVSAWVVELQRLAADVLSLPPAARQAVSEPFTAPRRPQRRREPWPVLVASARWS